MRSLFSKTVAFLFTSPLPILAFHPSDIICPRVFFYFISLRATSPSFDSPLNIWAPVVFSPPSPILIRLELESSQPLEQMKLRSLANADAPFKERERGRETFFPFKGERMCMTSCLELIARGCENPLAL